MCKILIVDDEQLLRQGFIHMTDWYAMGYKIIGEASNGVEALEIIKTDRPDIVVTDVRMPVMDGIELTRLIKESYPDIEIIILSSYSDFGYVKETLKLGSYDYILKQKMKSKDLLEVLGNLKCKIAGKAINNGNCDSGLSKDIEAFYKSLCTDKNLDSRFIVKFIEKLKIPLLEYNLRIVIIDFESISNGTNLKPQEQDDLNQLIQNVFSRNLSSVENLYSFKLLQNSIVFIFNYDSWDDVALKHSLACCQDIITRKYPVNLVILVTALFEEYKNIVKNVEKLLHLRAYTFYSGKNAIMFADDFQNTTSTLNYNIQQLDRQLSILDFKDIIAKVSDLVTQHYNSSQYIEPYSLKKSFILLYHHIIIKITERGYDLSLIDQRKFEFFIKIEETENVEDLLSVFRDILDIIYAFIKSEQMNYSNVIREIIKYLHENYNSNISLSSLAKQFHMNKNYLCEYFKQQTGKNFIDYLLNIRIDKSKELLLLPNHHINDICYDVGFSNPSYFTKVFKNIIGLTPSEYIRSQKINKS